MKLILILLLLCPVLAFTHGGDDGPSSLVEEFAKTSHIHLPVSYSTTEGLSFGLGGAHEEEHHDDDLHADETGLEINVHPIALGGVDKVKRLISAEESDSKDLTIESPTAQASYILVENKKWDIGLGIEGETHLPLPVFAAGLGISFIKGKNYYSLRTLNSISEYRKPLSFPVTQEAASLWRVGDELSFSHKGSLIFNAMVGIDPIVHIGPLYARTGTFKFKVKRDEEHFVVEVTTTKSTSLSFEGSAIVLNAEIGKSGGKLENLIYEFEADDIHLLKYLLQGRLDLLNREALNGNIVVKTSLTNTGSYRTANISVPFIYFNGRGSGTYYSEGIQEEVSEGHTNEIYSTASVKESFTRGPFSKHKWENLSVISTLVRGEDNILSSVLSWSYSQDKMSRAQISLKLSKISETLRAPWLAGVRFPEDNLEYLKADFLINFSGKEVLHLLHGRTLQDLEKAALNNLATEFETRGHRYFCRVRSYQNCLSRYQAFIQSKSARLKELRRSIEKFYADKNSGAITRELTQFVKTLFSSKYILGAYLERVPELTSELRLEGTRIKKHRLISSDFQ